MFYFSISGEGEQEAGLQEEADEWLSCNRDTTGGAPPAPSGAGPRPDGDIQKVAMQETHSSDFSLAFVMPPDQKISEETP